MKREEEGGGPRFRRKVVPLGILKKRRGEIGMPVNEKEKKNGLRNRVWGMCYFNGFINI